MWELSLGAMDTVDWLQRRMPYYVPFWCIMCQYHDESPAYLFMHCSFDSRFQYIILEVFGWFLISPNIITDLLTSFLVGPPFGGTKKMVWQALTCAFFRILWGKCNGRLFRGSFSSFDRFMDFVLSTAFYWWKIKHPSNHLSLSYLVSNLKIMLQSPLGVRVSPISFTNEMFLIKNKEINMIFTCELQRHTTNSHPTL